MGGQPPSDVRHEATARPRGIYRYRARQAHLTGRLIKCTCQVVRNRVRELRERAGLSQGGLAAELGVSRQTINSIEMGRYLPSLPLALALARFFELPVEDIFDDRS